MSRKYKAFLDAARIGDQRREDAKKARAALVSAGGATVTPKQSKVLENLLDAAANGGLYLTADELLAIESAVADAKAVAKIAAEVDCG
jgi:hypothetical protein